MILVTCGSPDYISETIESFKANIEIKECYCNQDAVKHQNFEKLPRDTLNALIIISEKNARERVDLSLNAQIEVKKVTQLLLGVALKIPSMLKKKN